MLFVYSYVCMSICAYVFVCVCVCSRFRVEENKLVENGYFRKSVQIKEEKGNSLVAVQFSNKNNIFIPFPELSHAHPSPPTQRETVALM